MVPMGRLMFQQLTLCNDIAGDVAIAEFWGIYHYGVSGCPQVAHYLGNDLIPHAMFRILIPSHSIAHSLGGKLTQKVGPNWANTCLQNMSQKATPTDPKSVLLKCPKN